MVDLSLWLSPLDGENPSGESLRDDPRFQEMERLVEPQVKVVRDSASNASTETVVPADWSAVLDIAEELRPRGRDLRVLVMLTRALANEGRFAGLAEGLNLIAQTFENFWPTMHPALREGAPPREAAQRRISALAQLQDKDEGLLADLRRLTYFAPRAIGPVTGKDLERAAVDERTVLAELPGAKASEQADEVARHKDLQTRVRTAFVALQDQNAPEMATLVESARAAAAALDAVDKTFNAQTGSNGSPLPLLRQFLERALSTIELGAAGSAKPAETAGPDATPATGSAAAADLPPAPRPAGLPDRLASRDDVLKCLDLVIAFYDRTEPSSPIPHLARRIRRMVPMDFMQLMEDLAPSGIKEFRLAAGMPEAKK